MADLTSSVYSMVVIASTTLGLSQYIQNTYRTSINNTKLDVERFFLKECTTVLENQDNLLEFEEIKKSYDTLVNQPTDRSIWQVGGLFFILPYAAVLQIFNIGLNNWNPLGWLELTQPFMVMLGYVTLLGLVLWTGWSLLELRRVKDGIEITAEALKARGRTAHNTYVQSNKNPDQSNAPSPLPASPSPASHLSP